MIVYWSVVCNKCYFCIQSHMSTMAFMPWWIPIKCLDDTYINSSKRGTKKTSFLFSSFGFLLFSSFSIINAPESRCPTIDVISKLNQVHTWKSFFFCHHRSLGTGNETRKICLSGTVPARSQATVHRTLQRRYCPPRSYVRCHVS